MHLQLSRGNYSPYAVSQIKLLAFATMLSDALHGTAIHLKIDYCQTVGTD